MAGEEELVLFPADSCEENTLLDDVDLPADLVFLMESLDLESFDPGAYFIDAAEVETLIGTMSEDWEMSESPIPTSAMLTNWGSSQNQNPSSNKRAFLELEQDELDFLLSPKRFRHELSPVPNGTYSMFWSEPGSMESEDDDDVDDGHIDEEEIAVLFSPSIMTFDWSFDDISEHLSMQGPAGRKTTISESSDPGYNTDDGQEEGCTPMILSRPVRRRLFMEEEV